MSATKEYMTFPSLSKKDIDEIISNPLRQRFIEKMYYDALSAPPLTEKDTSIEADVREWLQDRFGRKYKRFQGYWMKEDDLVALAEHYFSLGLMGKQLKDNE